MSTLEKRYRRNFVVALILHFGIVGGIVLTDVFGNRPPPATGEVIEADILGDMPKGEKSFGRGLYKAPTPPGGGAAAPTPPSKVQGESASDDDTAPPKTENVALPKANPNEASIQQKVKTKKPVAEARTEPTDPKTAAIRKNVAANTATAKPPAKPATNAKPKGTGSGSNAEDIKNDFAKLFPSSDGGTSRGDGKRAGGGKGEGPIGSRDGVENGVVGGVGHGTPNWEYFRHVHDALYEAWDQPGSGVDKSMVTTINLRIARDGSIEGVTVRIGSGNKEMDESVLQAVRKVSRLEPPPDALVHGDVASIPIHFSIQGS